MKDAKRVGDEVYMTRLGFEKYQFNYTRCTGYDDTLDVIKLVPEFFKDVIYEIDKNTYGLLDEIDKESDEVKWRTVPHFEHALFNPRSVYFLVKKNILRDLKNSHDRLEGRIDEHMHYVKFNDDIVAQVTNTRDTGNYHRFNFFENIDAAVLKYQKQKEFWDSLK